MGGLGGVGETPFKPSWMVSLKLASVTLPFLSFPMADHSLLINAYLL